MLTETTKHALRALVVLAGRPEGERMLGRDLAVAAKAQPNYLAKILLSLRRAGMVKATRGGGGGYALAMPPEKITLMQVVEVFEGVLAQPACLLGLGNECSDLHPCSAHNLWREVRQHYIDFLNTTTVLDIASSPDGLSPLDGAASAAKVSGGGAR